MKLPFCETVGNFSSGNYQRLPVFAQQSPQADVPVLTISHKIIFYSPAGGQFQSDSGELANGLYRERFDNA